MKQQDLTEAKLDKFSYIKHVIDHEYLRKRNVAFRVLISIWSHSDETGGSSYPSWVTLMREAKCTKAAVQEALLLLELEGLIRITSKGHQYRSTGYQLTVDTERGMAELPTKAR